MKKLSQAAFEQARRGHASQHRTVRRVDFHRVEPNAGIDVALENAQSGDRAQHVALLDDPHAVDRPGRVLLDHRYGKTALS